METDLLREGFALFRSFQTAMSGASEKATRGAILGTFKPRFGEYASKVESFLETQPALPMDVSSRLRSAAVLARDGEDQSTAHPDSYLSRVAAYLQTGSASSGPESRPDQKKILLIVAAAVLVWFLFFRRR
jgi:hypothetical protein